ncbi:MAG: hypothetical protein KKA73_04485 [Chloroflexi bacterium]|nr:hypothetical protein [Chloroflexota bacterium]MBU1746924.1 hypothetical protein [Chloroflexota bacterium]
MTKARGMRDIPTIQGLRNRATPVTREQAVTELARLEHEKARLQRELNTWIVNQEKTEERLRQLEERLSLVQQILGPPAAAGSARPAGTRRSPTEPTAGDPDPGPGWREMSLEY